MKCRHCNKELIHQFIDLGVSAPSNSFIKIKNLRDSEKSYPLRVLVCDSCWLVQTEDFVNASEMFSPDYAYFSSYSSSFLNHARKYVEKMVSRFSLNENSMKIIPITKVFTKETAGPNIIESGTKDIKKKYD